MLNSIMRYYLKTLSIFYLLGGILHVLDLCDLRLKFSEMNLVWKTWIIYLIVFDLLAAVGLWKKKNWGIVLFILIALSQLIAYSGLFIKTFGNQMSLVLFHLATLSLYALFKIKFNHS